MSIALPRRFPLLPTLLVALAVAAMIGLGIWQIQRAGQKETLLAHLAANPSRSAIAYPALGPVAPDSLFRRSAVTCLSVERWQEEAGRAKDGSTGFRQIAHCRTGAEGPGALISLGVAGKPGTKPEWTGGEVSGWITEEPDHRSLIAHLVGPKVVLRPMLIADGAHDPALKAPALPSTQDIPNNHIGYAIQWFGFAIAAAIIYVLALGRKQARDAVQTAQTTDAAQS
jgi:cytochrome oxidase assembly protein ShyY1